MKVSWSAFLLQILLVILVIIDSIYIIINLSYINSFYSTDIYHKRETWRMAFSLAHANPVAISLSSDVTAAQNPV